MSRYSGLRPCNVLRNTYFSSLWQFKGFQTQHLPTFISSNQPVIY
ncbi:hypothetical protein [Aeromonas phage Akh-2]|nr:hypothetical protein [Aeromonas phage Akh-2]